MRCNLIGLCGFALSSLAVVLFIKSFWLESLGFGSGDSQLRRDMLGLQFGLGAWYFVGVGISAFSSFGSLVQLPILGVLLPLAWYLDSADSAADYAVFALAFIAAFILVLSMFVEVGYTSRKLLIPPKSRMRWWHIREVRFSLRPLSRSAKDAIVSVVAVSALILASFTFYVRANDVSRLTVVVLIDGGYYGSVDFTVYLDGESVYSGASIYWMDESLYLKLPSGSHTLELDVWNDSGGLSVGVIDSVSHVRTLPFAEETTYLTFGVYLQ